MTHTGPRARFPGHLVYALRSDPLRFLTRIARTYGDFVPFRIGRLRMHLVNDPEAIRECLSHLTPRARKVWYLRVLLELPSQEVARHPEVQMTRTSVDVTFFRARAAVRRCLRTRSLDWDRVPEGTFVQLWELLESQP